MSKLVVFGSARIDVFLELPPSLAEQMCRLDSKECFIALSYAAKLPLNDVSFLLGGNGANVAIGTNRLGVDTTLVAELGEGPLADYAYSEISKELKTEFVSQTKDVRQGFGAVIVYQGERTILSYYPPERPPFPQNLGKHDWAYLTSVGENFEGFFENVHEWLNKNDTKLAFNPGGRQIKKGKKWLGKYLKETELLLVNREEGQSLAKFPNSLNKEKQLLDALSALGPKQVIVTDGANGSFTKGYDGYYRLGILPIDPIERTGAGDAFSSGVLSALIKGLPTKEALLWGTINSASKIGYVGPQKGLLKESDLPEWLERAKSSGVEVVEF